MAGSLRKYTVQEADNAALGQAGSVFISTADADVSPTNGVFVAVTIIADAKFNDLIPEDGAGKQYMSTGSASDSGGGDTLTNATEFPAGVTIYGRWKTIDIDAGSVIAYIG
tara:strand:- start:70 stop:402 length:333 start_codon:yes stop_codon:yes gene_type:complete